MPCPPPLYLQGLISQVLERSDSFQGRVAARGQIQLSLEFPQNAKWVALLLGPPDYALTGADGRELSDRWTEALLLSRWARELWHQV
jgi:hypothetical protein